MAGTQQAKSDFEQILSNIERRFDIIHTTWSEQKFFEAKFRTQIPRDSEDFNFLCDEWVELFSQITNTVWVKKISNTGPKIRFRKQYQCWTHGGKTIQKELLFDARRCKGTLDVKVLTDNPMTRRKNKHIRLGLNVVVKINFVHLHPVDVAKPYAFFVHDCKPLAEPPKPVVVPNTKLPQLVTEMVQKGLNSTPKAIKNLQTTSATTVVTTAATVQTVAPSTNQPLQNVKILQIPQQKVAIPQQRKQPTPQPQPPETLTIPQTSTANIQYIDDPTLTTSSVQINQIIPMESIKFQMQPQLTQVVVATTPTQLEVATSAAAAEQPLFMCQPTLMFEPGDFIPMATIPPHFVQINHHSSNVHNQQGHFL